jgi:putative membrane protein
VIANTGSRARDHLAAERTFLAWIRTALGLIGLGVIIGKFVVTDGILAEIVGLALIFLGAAMLGYSLIRFERLAASIDDGMYRPAYWGPIIVAVVSIIVSVGSVIIVVL